MGLLKKLRTLGRVYHERHEIGLFLKDKEDFYKYRFEKQAFADMAVVDKGVVQEDELPLLKELVQQANAIPGDILEIGTLFGFTTQKLALWKAPDKKIRTIDNYCWNPLGFSSAAHLDFTSSILWYLIQTGHIELINAGKDEFFQKYTGPVPALVFIDADHSYEATLTDIRQARRIGAGIICGHDYCDLFPGVKRAVNESGGAARLCGSVWALN